MGKEKRRRQKGTRYKSWQGLYEAAVKIKDLAPWEWMTEQDLFAVENPDTGELGFVSVMGELGEHLAVSLYLGARGLIGYLSLLEFPEEEMETHSEFLLNVPQLQASFEDRQMLTTKDLRIIRGLGLKFRGRNAWPMFRSFKPGFVPWYLEPEEVKFLQIALEQTHDVATRFRDDPSILMPKDQGAIKCRVATKKGDRFVWTNSERVIGPPEPEPIDVFLSADLLERVKNLPRFDNEFEVDAFSYPMPVRDKRGARPYYPYALMVVDSQIGHIAGMELMGHGESLADMWASVPDFFLKILEKFEGIPRRIFVRSYLLDDLLGPVGAELGFDVELADDLPSIKKARLALTDFLKAHGVT